MLKEALLKLLVEHQDLVIETALGMAAAWVAISIAKLPDPRKWENATSTKGQVWYYFYSVFFAFASRYSGTEWNRLGGRLTVPGFQEPPLSEVPHPLFESREGFLARHRVPPGAELTEVLHKEDVER